MKSAQPMPLLLVIVGLLCLNMITAASAKGIALALGAWGMVSLLAGVLILSYTIRLFAWTHLGRRYQLSFIYPLLSINYVAAAVVGYYVFDEPLPANRILGLALIVGGVVILATSRHRHEAVPPATGGTP